MRKPIAVARLMREPGRHAVGNNVYLQVTSERARSWVFRFEKNGKGYHLGLGSCSVVSLAEAREKGLALRKLLAAGIDPLEHRKAQRQQAAVAVAKSLTFRAAAEHYMAAHESAWSNSVHRSQWTQSLAAYVHPIIGDLPVSAIDTALVTKVLEPIWLTKRETARRVRGRIEAVLDWAKAHGHRDGENPARWRGHLENLLPKRPKHDRPIHHAAMPYADVPAFMAELRQQDSAAAKALEFTILTAARSGEVLGASWGEIDGDVWTIAGSRMKAGRDHRVPLTERCLALLTGMAATKQKDGIIFPGARGERLTPHTMPRLLERMGHDATVHGFRSAFRDWCAEQTNFPREVAEAALAHVLDNKVEAAYQRGDLLLKRRALMDAWADYCAKPVPTGATVVPIGARRA
jgi:integrase